MSLQARAIAHQSHCSPCSAGAPGLRFFSLVCTKLWKSLPSDVKVIDTKYIENLGDVDDALAVYYESCIAQVVKQTRTNEGTLRAWFERKLITPDGLRGIVPKGAPAILAKGQLSADAQVLDSAGNLPVTICMMPSRSSLTLRM